MVEKTIEDIAREKGVSEIALNAWRSIKGLHDFLPWEFDNETGELHRSPPSGFTGVTGNVEQPWKRGRLRKPWE